MRGVFLVWTVLALSLLLTRSSSADDPAKPSDTGSAEVTSVGTQPAAKSEAMALLRASVPEPAAQKPRGAGADFDVFQLTPTPATSGALGLFTLETGEALPTRGVSFSTYVNKFSRMPGSVSVLNVGLNFAVGVRDWLTLYTQFEPHRHIHAALPAQLIINCPGEPAGYVEDYPFVTCIQGGIGEVTAGFKLRLLSEARGHPVSLSVRNDFIFPTRTELKQLLHNGSQTGEFNYGVTLALSKTWDRVAILTGNWAYRVTRDPRALGPGALSLADQIRVGAGILLFPQSRIQALNEYNGLIFVGTATPNTTFGARDPVEGIWGVRLYAWENVAVDLGYRYMLNLRGARDRHGFVIKLGLVHRPEKRRPANRPPVASCSVDKSSVYAQSGDSVTVRVQASDPDGHPLTYSWWASGGRLEGSGTQVRWYSAGAAPGTYTVTVRVDDGHGGTATCTVVIGVEPRPNRPPILSCSIERSAVLIGERVRIAAVASDPDGAPLTYSWRTDGGRIIGSGASVLLDTTGLNPGHYTVSGRVEDGRGGAADCSVGVDVQAPPPVPQASKLNECSFRASSAQVDNVCKRILDDVALRLKNEPRASVVIVGYADPKEPKSGTLAGQRAQNAAEYLVSKGIQRTRIQVRAAGGQEEAGEKNRRIEVVWVPEGATC